MIVLLALLGGALGAVPSAEKSVDATTSFTASHTLLLSTTSVSQGLFSDPIAFNQLQLFATTGEVPRRVADKLDYADVPAALAAQVTVTVDTANAALRISTTQQSADQAVAVADGFADELVTYLAERQDTLQADRLADSLERLGALEADVADVQEQLAATPEDPILTAQLSAVTRQYEGEFELYRQLQESDNRLQLTTLERAQPIAQTSTGLSAPTSRTSRGILAGLVGALLGLAVAVLWARADKRIRTRAQAETIIGLRSQVNIPPDATIAQQGIVVLPGRHDSISDAYRTLRSVVGFVEAGLPNLDGRAPIALVLSAGSGDGKTSVSTNLAAAFVESGTRTVAVNTDFRRPALAERILGHRVEPPGFFAEDIPDLPLTMVLNRTSIEGLSLFDIAGAIGSPGDLARATARLLPQMAQEFGAVVIDSSPVGATAEVLEIVPRADVIVLVVRLDHTYIESAQRTMEIIRTLTNAPLLLTLVGEAPERYDNYYDYGSKPAAKKSKQEKRKPAKSRG